MHKINVILFSELPGGMTPHDDGETRIEFHRCSPLGPLPEVTGTVWVLVDWVLPELSGLEVCRRLRCNPLTASMHITMVLDDDDAAMRRRAIASGANDNLIGPLDRANVLGRLLAREVSDLAHDPSGLVRLDDLIVDISAFQARWRGRPIPMMPIQLRLLRFFMEHPGQIYTRTQLMAALGNDAPLEERTVDVWVGRLRRALKGAGAGNLLRTVRSLGYTLEPPRRMQRRGKAA
ncbi:MAG: winged helix-turn-helix domain-containing protein [Sphingomonadales bacterium]|nr:winged helix-turn-helix domain-containing protein [Sphingomonadales bacterium]